MPWGDLGVERAQRTDEQIRAAQLQQWGGLGKTGLPRALAELLHEEDAIAPNGNVLRAGKRRLDLLSAGGRLTVSSPVCPDYAWGLVNGVPVYTFDGLGEGVGIVARRTLDVHAKLAKLFKEHGVLDRVNFRLYMADQEANEANCRRVELSQEEFLAKLKRSREAIVLEARRLGFEAECANLTESGKTSWESAMEQARKLVDTVKPGRLDHIVRARGPLLQKWGGKLLTDEEVRASVMGQGLEYVAAGIVLSGEGAIIPELGAHTMSVFTQVGAGDTPVFSFKRPDY